MLKPKLWNRLLQEQPLNSASKSIKSMSSEKKSEEEEESARGYVKLEESMTRGLQWCVLDAGLFQSRRFRPFWSLNPQLGHAASRLAISNSSIANSLQLFTVFSRPAALDRLEKVRENCEAYLNVQLELTDFIHAGEKEKRSSRLAWLRPRKGNELIRRCFECTQQIRNSIGNVAQSNQLSNVL